VLLRSRSLLLSLVSVSYVLAAGLRASPDKGWGIVAFIVLPLGLLLVWSRSAPPARGEDWVTPITRRSMRACAFGVGLLAAARVAPPHLPWFEATAVFGTSLAGGAALVALARIAPLGGLLTVPRGAERLHAAVALVLAGTGAALAPLAGPNVSRGAWAEPSVVDATCSVVATLSLASTILTAWRLRRLRRLDLGAGERLSAALTLGWVALLIGVPASLLGIAPASHVLELAASLAAFAITMMCLARDPTFVARTQRVLVAVSILAAPMALFAASIAAQAPHRGASMAVVALVIGVGIGLVGVPIARPLAPEQSKWIDAIQGAGEAALRADPETAVTAALSALRQGLGPSSTSPELWRIDPPALITVDRAGYARTDPTLSAPGLLFDLAKGEPEQTVRTAVLEKLEVRRPDIRPALEWLRVREATSFTLLTDTEGPVAGLVLPVGMRTQPLTLEEVRALRALADRLAALVAVSAALARAHDRAALAQRSAELEEDRARRFEQLVTAGSKRAEMLTRRLARPAQVAPYSAAARRTVEELERIGKLGATTAPGPPSTLPVSLLTPPGIDPIPYAAVVHGAGPRRTGPFVVVDAAGSDEQKETTWRDPATSPLCLADGGSMVILSVAALPAATQAFVAEALAERRSPAGDATPLDVLLIVSVPTTVDTLVASGQLQPLLADWLGDRAVPLPALSARSDDLRALFVDRLARLGVRLKGRPMGLDAQALGRLVEHSWPGNELELEDVLTRAVAVAAGDVLTSTHLDQIGFIASAPKVRRGSRPPAPGKPTATTSPVLAGADRDRPLQRFRP